MTVGEMLVVLRDLPPETLVILEREEEGYLYYAPLGTVDTNAVYEAAAANVFYAYLTPEMRAVGFDNGDLGSENAVPCVCLVPD